MHRYFSILWSIFVIFARPTETTTPQEPNTCESSDETKEDTGQTEDRNSDDASSDKERAKPNIYIETATSHDRYSPVLPSFEHNYGERNCKEYGSPGPPNRLAHTTYESGLSEQRESSSRMSLDRYPSEASTVELGGRREVLQGETTAAAEQGIMSWGSLSADDLTFDARACALPKRRPKGAETKSEKLKQSEGTKHDIRGDRKQTMLKANDTGSIEDFIKDIVAMQFNSKARVDFFDAAIVYEKEDYYDALNFKEETLMIVKSELNEEVRIELYDSQEFDQSKICVVQDVIDKCSVIFVYLTNNFKSPELKFFIEEAIGICRLGLNNKDIQAGTIRNDRQWVIKPVHTAPPKMRAYRIPTGLLTVNGIEWYNKDSSHTRQQIRAVIHAAINTRKQREMQTNISHAQIHMPVQGASRQMAETYVPNTRTDPKPFSTNAQNRRQENLNSHQSHDAMSFVGESGHFYNSQFGSLPDEQSAVPAGGNIFNRFQQIPPSQTNPPNVYNNSNPRGAHDAFHGQGHSFSHHFGPTYPEHNMNRNFPPNSMYTESTQSGQDPQMRYQHGQYMSPTGFPQFHGQIVQSAGMQDRNVQPAVNRNFLDYSNQLHTNMYQGNVPFQNSNSQMYYHPNPRMAPVPQPGFSRQSHTEQGYKDQQNITGMSAPANSWHGNYLDRSQVGGGMPMNRHGMYQQVPLRQQDMNAQQQFSHYQDQPLTRDALRSESGNFLSDQRNDAPPSTQLSVVSKVTGKLIVNPNLSTDDVEIDNYVSTQNSHSKINSKTDRRRGKRATKIHVAPESDSSSDSDFDMPKAKENRWKKKVVNVVGCKIVQMGSRNKVKEKATKNNDVGETSLVVKSKCNEIQMKQSPENVGSSPAMISIPKYSLEKQGTDLTSATESNNLSTDNMSAGSSILRNLDTGLGEKLVADKTDIPGTVLGDSDGRLYERGIELNHLSSVVPRQEHCPDANDISNDQSTNIYSKFTSLQSQGSAKENECPNSPEDNLSDSDDYLFESGTYNSNIPKVAPFMFSKAKIRGINVLKRSSDYTMVITQQIKQENEENEID